MADDDADAPPGQSADGVLVGDLAPEVQVVGPIHDRGQHPVVVGEHNQPTTGQLHGEPLVIANRIGQLPNGRRLHRHGRQRNGGVGSLGQFVLWRHSESGLWCV